jgi:hypothetical protein
LSIPDFPLVSQPDPKRKKERKKERKVFKHYQIGDSEIQIFLVVSQSLPKNDGGISTLDLFVQIFF